MFFNLYLQYIKAQEELSALRQESTQTAISHNTVSLMEKEKELALSDLRRIMAEKEALKEKLKVRIDLIDLFLKDNLLRKGEVFLYVFL